MRSIKTIRGLAALLTAVTILATSPELAAAKQKSITIHFEAVVGKQPFACGQSYDGIGLSKSRITPSDLRFFVSEVELIDNKGKAIPLKLEQDGIWQYRNVTLLDFENGSGPCLNGNIGLHTAISGTAPHKHYQRLRFTLGIPADLNHGDSTIAPPPLNVTSLFWTWRAGYKFFRLDMATTAFPLLPKLNSKVADDKSTETEEKDNAVAIKVGEDKDDETASKVGKKKKKVSGFPIHLGSTNCVSPTRTTLPTSCAHPNRVTVNFDDFDAEKNVIVVDIASLLQDTNVDYHARNSVAGCMADIKDEDCKSIMANFGAPFNEQPAFPQHFLRVR